MSEEAAEPTENEGDNTNSAADAVAEMANDRPENVPEKFWDAEAKAVRTDAVLKSYGELEKRFGSFTGAPEDYSFNVSEEMGEKFKEMGIEINTDDDPLYAAALEMAKETGMNQEGFDRLSNLYLMSQLGELEAMESYKAEQMKLLGDRAESRLNNLKAWGEGNLSPELYEAFGNVLNSAESVQVFEHLIAQTRNAPVADPAATSAPAFSASDLQAMQFALDDNGNRKIQTDPTYRAEYQRKMKEFYGDGENRIMVG